jgi:hypothetical protein
MIVPQGGEFRDGCDQECAVGVERQGAREALDPGPPALREPVIRFTAQKQTR